MSPVPLLIISDSPAGSTGLGRLTRELATRIHTRMPDVFKVATLGYHGQHSSRLPFPQYQIRSMGPGRELYDLPEVVNDFFQAEAGVVMACWNPGWLDWMAHPEGLEGEANEPLKQLLTSGKVKRWIYAPIDAEGPTGMPAEIRDILSGFDRRLFYTSWAADLYDRATERKQVSEHLPHGIEDKVFHPRDRKLARETFMPRIARLPQGPVPDHVMLVGAVATNTPRKDWPLAFDTVAKLVERGRDAILWAHTDSFYREYDFNNLTHSFGLNHRVIPTKHYLSSDKLAWAYSACDVVLAPGSEGFGYVLAEALACGVSVVHGNYAGGAEIVPNDILVDSIAWRHEGLYCHKRPIFDADHWASRAIQLAGKRFTLHPSFYWENCWPKWDAWLREGIGLQKRGPSDYSQPGDPYEIEKVMTSQSAAVDVRGNSGTGPRSIPTQVEADAVVAQARLERLV